MARIARDEETKKETFHEKEEEQLLREKGCSLTKKLLLVIASVIKGSRGDPYLYFCGFHYFYKRKIFSFLFHRRSIISLVAGAPPITVLGVIANCSPSATSQAKQKKGQ